MKATNLNTIKSAITPLLIITNAVLLLAYMLHDIQNGLQMYYILPIIIILLTMSSLYHIMLWLSTRKKNLKIVVKIPLYLLPVIMLVSLSVIFLRAPDLPNQQSKLVSFDKKYTMKMDMKHNRWIISIYNGNGKKLYSDDSSNFHGQFDVYWVWDHNDRLWLYNSDDSFVYY